MNNPKVLEAIAELESQRKTIDDAILHLRRAHEALNGSPVGLSATIRGAATVEGSLTVSSYVDEAVRALEANGAALHINPIIDFIGKIRGERPPRASVESSLIRHISKTSMPRVVKVGKSIYDLPQRQQPPLAKSA